MVDIDFLDIEVKDVQIEEEEEKSVTLTWIFVNLQQDVINKIMESSYKIRKHYGEDLPIKYLLEISEIPKFSWISYFDKSEILGIELHQNDRILVGSILDRYNNWHELHKSKIKPQYDVFANQVPSFEMDGITFATKQLSESFCEWYISSNLGFIKFNLGSKPIENNSHEIYFKNNIRLYLSKRIS